MAGTLKVRLLTLMAGPEGVFAAGSERVLERKKALSLIDGGYAEAVSAEFERATGVNGERAVSVEIVGARTLKEVLGENAVKMLAGVGIVTVEDFENASQNDLTAIEGVGPVTAKKWRKMAEERN